MKEQEQKYKNAKKRVKELKEFYIHLITYIVINIMLVFINLTTSTENLWFIWPLMGWGIAIVLHAIRTFGGILGSDWEENKIKELMKE